MVDAFDKAQAIQESVLATAYLDGKASGEASGLARGRLEVARNLLTSGIDVSVIASSTGLDIATIESL